MIWKLQQILASAAIFSSISHFFALACYANEIREEAYNESFHVNLESNQCKASLAITEEIVGTPKE